jgi:hypothetical protein
MACPIHFSPLPVEFWSSWAQKNGADQLFAVLASMPEKQFFRLEALSWAIIIQIIEIVEHVRYTLFKDIFQPTN